MLEFLGKIKDLITGKKEVEVLKVIEKPVEVKPIINNENYKPKSENWFRPEVIKEIKNVVNDGIETKEESIVKPIKSKFEPRVYKKSKLIKATVTSRWLTNKIENIINLAHDTDREVGLYIQGVRVYCLSNLEGSIDELILELDKNINKELEIIDDKTKTFKLSVEETEIKIDVLTR